MIPIQLSLHNFMSYQDECLDFESFAIACISGDNGVGKSSLLEAITWTIWGKSRADSDDDLIYQGSIEMWTDLIFRSEKDIYRIIRKRSRKGRGKTNLEFQVDSRHSESATGEIKNPKQIWMGSFPAYLAGQDDKNKTYAWRSVTEPTIKETQAKINRVLNLSYEIFTNSSYLRQGKADEFTIKSASERKEILAKILNLDFYDRLSEKAKEKNLELRGREQALNFKIADLKESKSGKSDTEKRFKTLEKQISALEKNKKLEEEKLAKMSFEKQRFDSLEQKLNHIRERYQQEKKYLRSFFNDLKTIAARQEQAMQQLTQKKKIEEKAKWLLEYRQQEKEYTKKLQISNELQPQLSSALSKQETVEESISRIKKISNCPTCLRRLSDEEGKKIISSLEKIIKDKISPVLKNIKSEIDKIGYSKEKHILVQRKIQELKEVEDEIRILDQAEIQSKELTNQEQKLNKEIREKRAVITKLESEGKKISKERDNFKGVEEKYNQQELRLLNLRQKTEEAREEFGRVQEQIRQKARDEENLSKCENELQSALTKKGIYEELVNSYGRNGVQAMIIENTIPAIEEEANILLEKMSGNGMKVKFLTQRTKKYSEDTIETLDIQISDYLGSRQYELFSGGEAFRINFAIRIAISKLLALRAGAKLEFLSIDEGFGMLDKTGQDDLIAAIKSIEKDFAKIIVITHIQDIKNVFQDRIEVEKEDRNRGSKIKILN